jgi:hypothetical protein
MGVSQQVVRAPTTRIVRNGLGVAPLPPPLHDLFRPDEVAGSPRVVGPGDEVKMGYAANWLQVRTPGHDQVFASYFTRKPASEFRELIPSNSYSDLLAEREVREPLKTRVVF